MGYRIVLQRQGCMGRFITEYEDDLPTEDVIEYYEDFWSDHVNKVVYVVVNVFPVAKGD